MGCALSTSYLIPHRTMPFHSKYSLCSFLSVRNDYRFVRVVWYSDTAVNLFISRVSILSASWFYGSPHGQQKIKAKISSFVEPVPLLHSCTDRAKTTATGSFGLRYRDSVNPKRPRGRPQPSRTPRSRWFSSVIVISRTIDDPWMFGGSIHVGWLDRSLERPLLLFRTQHTTVSVVWCQPNC